MAMILTSAGWLLAGLALCGAAYALAAAFFAGRFMCAEGTPAPAYPPVTILKPLHLGEPGLFDNLESFLPRTIRGQVQIVFGVHDAKDPAIAVVRALQARYPHLDTSIVADGALDGFNAKISNLINMLASGAARHIGAVGQRHRRSGKLAAQCHRCVVPSRRGPSHMPLYGRSDPRR